MSKAEDKPLRLPPPHAGDMRVLALIEQAARSRAAQPTNEQMMLELGAKSVSSAVSTLARLEHAGLIRVERIGRNGRIIHAGDGSWSIGNSYAVPGAPVAPKIVGPRRDAAPKPQVAAEPAPVVVMEAPLAVERPRADRAMGEEAAAGAPLAALREAERDDQAADKIRHLRAQLSAVAPLSVRYRTCRLPEWENKPDHRYCDKPTVPGRPYCAGCCAVAYVRREKAA